MSFGRPLPLDVDRAAANDAAAHDRSDPRVDRDSAFISGSPMNGQFAAVCIVCVVVGYLLVSRRDEIRQTSVWSTITAEAEMVPRKFWMVVGVVVVYVYAVATPLTGMSEAVFVGCAVGCYLLLRRRGALLQAPVESPFAPEVRYAVGVLTDEKKLFDLFRVLNLFVASRDKRGRVVRTFPLIVSVVPTAFGASVQLDPVDGQDLATYRGAASRLATALMVPAVVVSESRPGSFQLDLRVFDPLDSPLLRETVTPVSDWALELGSDESGVSKRVPISNVSGVVVGGLPGSGKTAWLTQTLATFAGCDAVQMVVVDGKGGMDLNALNSRSYQFINDDMDLDAVISALSDVKELVRERSQKLHSLFGTSNFWNHGPTQEVPVVFVLVDECQTFLDSRQLIGKELKAKGAEIHSLINFLVRKGRSAGVVTILSTQKPTADSLPTDIRDNSSVRICFGVQSRYAAEAVLGDEWTSDGPASPLGASVGVGVASVEGNFIRFRAPYVNEVAVSEWVDRFANLRGDPAQLLHNRLAQLS